MPLKDNNKYKYYTINELIILHEVHVMFFPQKILEENASNFIFIAYLQDWFVWECTY